MMKKEMVALLLAGGQGSRLGILTKTIAKPAVLYGGKYRIIDFTLSNCINSGIDTVGVLTQYQPLKLNSHIGIGKPWDLDRIHGGLTVLSPYLKSDNGEWYKGTANAVFQNIHDLEKISPRYVIVLSGDHIYKMNYAKMLEFHKSVNSEATISVIEVPWQEASRYGIMNTKENGEIFEFEEKPEKPKNNLASMGIYIFNWKSLKEYLVKDDQLVNSEHDFGKNIIPAMLNNGCKMWAYRFDGYWKDVGTIGAYWESNMDLIARVPTFNLFDHAWKIYSPSPIKPANYIGPNGSIKTSIVAEGCMIYGSIKNSVIFPGVIVKEDTTIEDSIIMSNSCFGKRSFIKKSILGERVVVGEEAVIGEGNDTPNELYPSIYNSGITVIGEGSIIPERVKIGKNVMVDLNILPDDFYSDVIASGKSILKAGDSK
jgi:glucose-1-phosphate adenylyltransferase